MADYEAFSSGDNVPDNVRNTFSTKDGELSTKFDSSEWKAAEVPIEGFPKKVIECLTQFGLGVTKEVVLNVAMGEAGYMQIREMLHTPHKLVRKLAQEEKQNEESAKGKKGANKKKVSGKADAIRMQNTMKRIQDVVKQALDIFKKSMDGLVGKTKKDFVPPISVLGSEILEVRGIALLYCASHFISNNSYYLNADGKQKAFEIIVVIQKFINTCNGLVAQNCSDRTSTVEFSSTLIADLQRWERDLIKEFSFNGIDLINIAPKLVSFTDYDKFVPSAGISPRDHQKKLLETVKQDFDDGFCIRYDPPIGGGKTFAMNIVLGAYASSRIKAGKKTIILFACNLKTVLAQAANVLYNASIKFAIGFADPTNSTGYRIINSFICKNDDELAVIVASADIAGKILCEMEKTTGTEHVILCFDEPTFGADVIGSVPLEKNMELFTRLPKRVVLSSATLPKWEHMKNIRDFFTDKYPTAKLSDINSAESMIGCDVISFNGDLVVPHLGAQTMKELATVIDVVNQSALFGRLYTQKVVCDIHQKMVAAKIPNIPDVNAVFSDVNNMSAGKVREFAMKLLTIVSTTSDDVVKSVCSSRIMSEAPKKAPRKIVEVDETFAWASDSEDDETEVDSGLLDFHRLGTASAWQFTGGTIVATTKPVEFARKNFRGLLDDIYSHPLYDSYGYQAKSTKAHQSNGSGEESVDESLEAEFGRGNGTQVSTYKSTRNAMAVYLAEIDSYQKQVDRLEQRTDDEETLSKQLQEMAENAPRIRFPAFGVVNSIEHMKKYAKGMTGSTDKADLRCQFDIENINVDSMRVSDDILTLLFAGIGIYDPDNKDLDEPYLQAVLQLAARGRLAMIIAGCVICYGADYSIRHVVITDDFADTYSVHTLMQLIGRAGRVGKSWRAFAHVSEKVGRRFVSYTRDMSDSIMEAKNMTDKFNEIRKLQIKKEEHDLEAMDQKVQDLLSMFLPKEKVEVVCVAKEKAEVLPTPAIVNISRFVKEVENPIPSRVPIPAKGSDSDWRKKPEKPVHPPPVKDSEMSWRRRDDPKPKQAEEQVEQRRESAPPQPAKYVPPFMRNRTGTDQPRSDDRRDRNRDRRPQQSRADIDGNWRRT